MSSNELEFTHWVDFKKFVDCVDIKTSVGYILSGGYYLIWAEFRGIRKDCKLKKNEGKHCLDWETNYMPSCLSDVDAEGKRIVRMFSGNQQTDTYKLVLMDDVGFESIWDAAGVLDPNLAFDTDTEKEMILTFNKPIKILCGTQQWGNGDILCRGYFTVWCPAGVAIDTDGDGVDETYPIDIPIGEYGRNTLMCGDQHGPIPIPFEAATGTIRPGWQIRITVTKSAGNTTFWGGIGLAIYESLA